MSLENLNVGIYSREQMEKSFAEGIPDDVAIISFYDPKSKGTPSDYRPLDYSGKCSRIFQVGVHDIDIETLEEFGLTFDKYFQEANNLAEFIYYAYNDGCSMICQCEYGQSRSAACAAAILEHFNNNGISVFADYRYYPNQLIFNKMLEALNRYKKTHQV